MAKIWVLCAQNPNYPLYDLLRRFLLVLLVTFISSNHEFDDVKCFLLWLLKLHVANLMLLQRKVSLVHDHKVVLQSHYLLLGLVHFLLIIFDYHEGLEIDLIKAKSFSEALIDGDKLLVILDKLRFDFSVDATIARLLQSLQIYEITKAIDVVSVVLNEYDV